MAPRPRSRRPRRRGRHPQTPAAPRRYRRYRPHRRYPHRRRYRRRSSSPPGPTPPTPAPPPGQPPAAPAAGQPGAPADPAAPAGERPLDQFPEEVRGYIASLRKEAGDYRMAAKTAEEKAAGQMKTWLDGIARTFGLIQDDPAVPPEQQIKTLGDQLTSAQEDHRASQVELALWKQAHAHGADPQRLTDSRAFMRTVAGLDPSASDFEQQLAAAVGTALAGHDYYRASPPAGQAPPATEPAPPAQPPVPSSGEFAGGTGGPDTTPQTVDDFRAALRQARGR